MEDMKIIFGVKLTYIDVHRPPTSWVCTVHGDRDIGSWWKFRGSQNGVKKVVQRISWYLNLENRDFLFNDEWDAKTDKARQAWGNFLFSHKIIFEMHISGIIWWGRFSKMWDLPTWSSKLAFMPLLSVFGPARSPPQRSQGKLWSTWKLLGIRWRMKVIMIIFPWWSYLVPQMQGGRI